MNNFWKGVSITLILLIGIVVTYNIYSGQSRTPNDMAVQSQKEYQRQLQINDQQMAAYREQQLETKRQLEENAKYLEMSKAQIIRMDRLIERREKQADRYDAILKKWEQQTRRQKQ